MRHCAWFVGLAVVAFFAPGHAHVYAQDGLPLELQWRAPAECPSAAAVRAELARIARARPGSLLTPLSARAEVVRRGPTYALTLQTEHAGERGERQLEAADCKTLVRTLTLVLALAYGAGVEMADDSTQPSAAPGEEQPRAPAAPPAPSATSPRPESPTDDTPPLTAPELRTDVEPPPTASRDDRLEWALWLGGGIQLGLLPTAALATSAGFESRLRGWSLGLQLTAWPVSSAAAITAATNVDARFDGLAGKLQVCRRLPMAAVVLGLCAGAQAAAVRGRSTGTASDGSAVAPWYAVVAGATLSWPRDSWLAGRIEAGLAGSLDRPRFDIDGLGAVHRVPALAGQFDAQLLVTL